MAMTTCMMMVIILVTTSMTLASDPQCDLQSKCRTGPPGTYCCGVLGGSRKIGVCCSEDETCEFNPVSNTVSCERPLCPSHAPEYCPGEYCPGNAMQRNGTCYNPATSQCCTGTLGNMESRPIGQLCPRDSRCCGGYGGWSTNVSCCNGEARKCYFEQGHTECIKQQHHQLEHELEPRATSGVSPSKSINPPATAFYSGANLLRSRQAILSSEAWALAALKSMESNADLWVDQPPLSVMQKSTTPPSGDKHDYVSLDKYYWPCNNPPPGVHTPTLREQSDPMCTKGVRDGLYCCLESCGVCGGKGCSDHTGGKPGCCLSNIRIANQSCKTHDPPCMLPPGTPPFCNDTTGLPWIRHDGITNPDMANYDHDRLINMTSAVISLSRAYYFGRRQQYGTTAAMLLRTWFLDSATAQSPTSGLDYGHFIPGVTNGSHGAMIDIHEWAELVDAVAMLRCASNETHTANIANNTTANTANNNTPNIANDNTANTNTNIANTNTNTANTANTEDSVWSSDDDEALRAWFKSFLHWMNTSPLAQGELNATNNHGVWFDVQVVAISRFVNDSKTFNEAVERTHSRVETSIRPNGTMPAELARTKSWSYSEFCLDAFFHLASLMVDDSLWKYKTSEGASIQKALDWQLQYVGAHAPPWPYQQIEPFTTNCTQNMITQCETSYGTLLTNAEKVFQNSQGKGSYAIKFDTLPGIDAQNSLLNLMYYLPR